MTDERCRHPGCQCKVEQGKQFCSPHCAQTKSAGRSGGGCDCGHSDCRA
ncbi:MAG TPA: metallothionein [Candidatus Dormibacteraeota bacterium]|nr:metallothionein [Candidatus Dormibacteraeota bacterium]